MKRQTILTGVAAMILMSLIGFYTGFLMNESLGPATNETTKFSENVNYTVGQQSDITTAEFDNRSIDLFHENSQEAKFYIDVNQDGSADIRLEDLEHNGQLQTTTKMLNVDNKGYRLYFRYRDSAEETGDAQLWLYRVEAL